MKEVTLSVASTEALCENVYKTLLQGEVSDNLPGQFVDFAIPGLYLRRPISVCDVTEDTLTIVYKVVGKGTEALSKTQAGDTLNALTALGNGYDLTLAGENPLLIGGGVGIPPLYYTAKRLIALGKKPTVLLGYNRKQEIFLSEEFRALGLEVRLATVDGSEGVKGFVTDLLPDQYTYFYTCGPEPMLKAVYRATETEGEFSFEERMGCGFGACMGCTCKTLFGNKRVCKDGPVFKKGEILW